MEKPLLSPWQDQLYANGEVNKVSKCEYVQEIDEDEAKAKDNEQKGYTSFRTPNVESY